MMGPFGHFWYTFLDKKYSKKTGLNILRKMICDQLFAAPIMNLMVLAGVTALEGKDFKHIMNLLKEKFLTVYAVTKNFILKRKIIFLSFILIFI